MSGMNNLDGIDVFVKVIQCGGFSAAARLMAMPVTTVSGKIASLEKRLGVTLIQRTTRKLSVTQAGDDYFKHCLKALDEMSAAEREISTSKAQPEGLLRITAPADMGHTLLPPVIRTYLNAFPKTQVELILTNRIVDLVGEGLDLAVRAGALKDSSLIAKRIKTDAIGLWASASYIKKNGAPARPDELLKHSFIGNNLVGNPIHLSNGREAVKIEVQPRIIVDDMEAAKMFVTGGDGISVLPSFMCEKDFASGKTVRILPKWVVEAGPGAIAISLVYPQQRFVPLKVQAFIEVAVKAYKMSN
jgi:DNA-binding transcriptional LysR family regulator